MRKRKERTAITWILTLAVSATPTIAADPTIHDLLVALDDLMRGSSSRGQMTMNVKTARWNRSLTLSVVSQGTENFLMRILSPKKEAGTATLKVGREIWNYLPKVDRTIKLPASMMAGSWMGSHFSNDDIVQDSRFSEHYDCELTERPADGGGRWVIRCVPHEDAVVVWGWVDLVFTAENGLPQEVLFFDEKGELARTMTFDDFGDLGGKILPRTTRMVPADKPEEYTEMIYDELEFDVELADGMFTLQELRRLH